MTWIPVDILAAIITELVLNDCLAKQSRASTWTKYYHLENPNIVKWSTLVPVIQEFFGHGKLKAVSFEKWLEQLEASAQMPNADATSNPGLKLLDMLQGLGKSKVSVVMDTKLTQKRSKVMQQLQLVNKNWMWLWLKQWAF